MQSLHSTTQYTVHMHDTYAYS